LIGSDIVNVTITPDQFNEIRENPTGTGLVFGESGFKTETGTNSDVLVGGSGDDILFIGDFDQATGGTGSDTF
jgi:Ca2+-binding RTX toxin-like protein